MNIKQAIKKFKPKKIILRSKGQVVFSGDKKALKNYFKSEEFIKGSEGVKEQMKYFKRSLYEANITVIGEMERESLITSFIIIRDITKKNSPYDIYTIELKLI